MGIRKPCKCFTNTTLLGAAISQPCDGTRRTYIIDRTPNHNKAMVTIINDSQCDMTAIIETDNDQIEKEVTPEFNEYTLQVEDLRRVSVFCEGEEGEVCSGFISVQHTYCICCP